MGELYTKGIIYLLRSVLSRQVFSPLPFSHGSTSLVGLDLLIVEDSRSHSAGLLWARRRDLNNNNNDKEDDDDDNNKNNNKRSSRNR